MDIQRGDIVTCSMKGDYGKPRPAVVVKSDFFNPTHSSVVVCPLTTHKVATPIFRLDLPTNEKNGVKQPSQIMIDKMMAIPRSKIGKQIGKISVSQQDSINKALKIWLGLLDNQALANC